jgi:hypothetical protein
MESTKIINNSRKNILHLNFSLLRHYCLYEPFPIKLDEIRNKDYEHILKRFFEPIDEFDYNAEK